jgi:hypothetical protein
MDRTQTESAFFDVDERVAGPSEEMEGASVLLEKYIQGNSTFMRKWDPGGTGVLPCDEINALFVGDEQEEERWLDPSSEECRTGYVMDKPPAVTIQVSTRIANSTVSSLVDSGATKSLCDWDTLVGVFGREGADKRLFKGGYRPYFEIADKSVVHCMGQVILTFYIEGTEFEHVFFVIRGCSKSVILGNDFLQCIGWGLFGLPAWKANFELGGRRHGVRVYVDA